MNGFIQKNPVSFKKPLYLPKKIITIASFGSSIIKPGSRKNRTIIKKQQRLQTKVLGKIDTQLEQKVTLQQIALQNRSL